MALAALAAAERVVVAMVVVATAVAVWVAAVRAEWTAVMMVAAARVAGSAPALLSQRYPTSTQSVPRRRCSSCWRHSC